MKCKKCGYTGQGVIVYQSSTQSEVTKCPLCRTIATDVRPHIKGLCVDCKFHSYPCVIMNQFVNKEKSYCSDWKAKDEA